MRVFEHHGCFVHIGEVNGFPQFSCIYDSSEHKYNSVNFLDQSEILMYLLIGFSEQMLPRIERTIYLDSYDYNSVAVKFWKKI